jgi:hypothetical protein
MTTKRKSNRYSAPSPNVNKTGEAVETVVRNPAHLILLGSLVTNFTHLELDFSHLLAKLLGTDWQTGFILLNQIVSPSARHNAMRAVLESSPRNAKLGPEYDDLLSEFSRLNSARNTYVHGIWTTDMASKATYIAKANGNIDAYLERRQLDFDDLIKLVDDIVACRRRILLLVYKK